MGACMGLWVWGDADGCKSEWDGVCGWVCKKTRPCTYMDMGVCGDLDLEVCVGVGAATGMDCLSVPVSLSVFVSVESSSTTHE